MLIDVRYSMCGLQYVRSMICEKKDRRIPGATNLLPLSQ